MRFRLITALILAAAPVFAHETYPPVDVLLNTTTTAAGEPLVYPDGTPQITVAVVTLQPGQKTGLHRHEAPLVGYILEGEITVDYGSVGIKVFKTGDALVEALNSPHAGENTGDGIARVLAVYAGSDTVSNTVPLE
ncbi:cupin domain-containing protein [uncultured Ruegeria sp.]|uniref:cupin domain-containing protein n=1 Tax=uncultured Ruegeria sp. TaxID=259304 RepID=UPI0026142C9B|nr:cupin domain-containing protein [uncultured Ruegeria sp.]